MTEYAFEGVTRSSASVSWSFATQTLAGDITAPFSDAIGGAYQGVIQAAFAAWAAVSGLNFTQVADSASADIRIGFGNFPASAIVGQTLVRATGRILNKDTVVRLLDPAAVPIVADGSGTLIYGIYNVSLFQVAVHEIGHALGLDHTTDPYTIMYPAASTLNRTLSVGDVEGINAIYPLYTVNATNPLQAEGAGALNYTFAVTRYSDPAAALTVAYSVAGAAYAGVTGSVAATASEFGGAFPTGQATFAAGSATTTVTVTVPASAAAIPDSGFALTINSLNTTIAAATSGANGAVILDSASYGANDGAAEPIYRFFSTSSGTHFFTASEAERNTLLVSRPDLTYEGADLQAIANPSTDPSAIPVYRFFDNRFGTHFYTASPDERNAVLASRPDLVSEGIAFYEDAVQRGTDVPVLRYFDTSNGTHFYSSSAAEQASIAATRPDLVSEGVAFYAPANT